MQVDAEAGSRLLAAKLERAAAENATLEQRLEQVPLTAHSTGCCLHSRNVPRAVLHTRNAVWTICRFASG